MPIGVIVNSLSTFIGGIVGAFVGHKLIQSFKENLSIEKHIGKKYFMEMRYWIK